MPPHEEHGETKGQPIYEGDIIQFSILICERGGEARRTIVKEAVALDPNDSDFILPDESRVWDASRR